MDIRYKRAALAKERDSGCRRLQLDPVAACAAEDDEAEWEELLELIDELRDY